MNELKRMTALQTKSKYLIVAILAAGGVSTVLTLLPYKRFTSIWMDGGTPDVTRCILDHFRAAFTGVYLDVAFLSILFPMVIFAELAILDRHPRIRTLFPIQGLLLLCAVFEMQWSMRFYFLEGNVRLLPTFYFAMLWVGLAAFSSFLLMSPRIQHPFQQSIAHDTP